MPFLTKITVWKLLVNKKDWQWKPHLYKICILGLSKKKKNRISNISRIFKKNPHSNAKRCIQILGVRQAAYQWRTRCDEDVGRCHCIFMLFFNLSSWTHWIRCSFKILRKKRTSKRRCCLRQNWNQAVRTERKCIIFSRGTSITVALASRKRESDI